MIRFAVYLILWLICFSANAQPTAGTTGLLNIPTAEMQNDGTFFAGANLLPVAITPADWDYNTGNYYLNITFLPFMEVSYRMTLLKQEQYEGFSNQDRSISLRLRPVREKKYMPSVVVGFNDLISSTAGIVTTKKYFSSVYIVSTKNFFLKKHHFSVTAGYLPDISKTEFMTGFFGGASYSPAKLESLKLMAEYDTRVFNTGASVLLFKHLYVYGMAHELKRFAGGFAFTIPLIR